MPRHNLYEFDRLYRRTIKGVGDSAAVVTIRLGPVGPRKLRVLTQVTFENRVSAGCDCRLAIDAGGKTHYLDEVLNLAIGELAVSRSDMLLLEGDYFVAEVTDSINGDELVLTCIGWDKEL